MTEKKHYLIDFSKVESYNDIHSSISVGLSIADYYGGNLDSLFDCLTEMLSYKSQIDILHVENLAKWNNYHQKLITTLIGAKHFLGEDYSSNLSIRFISKSGEKTVLSDRLETYNYLLDFSNIKSESDIHKCIAQSLNFAEYDGDLGSLWEYLLQLLYTQITKIQISSFENLSNYSEYSKELIDLLDAVKNAYDRRFADRFFVNLTK